MGSANLNDRSQCGDRDSEIALIVEDKDLIPSQMNGRYVSCVYFIDNLISNL
jgi:phospholipase D1/2